MKEESEMPRAVRKNIEAPVEVVPQVEESPSVKVDDKGRLTEVNKSMEEIDSLGLKTKSAVIRYLLSQGYAPSAVAKFLGIRYQFVRNISVQNLKRGPREQIGSPEGAEPGPNK